MGYTIANINILYTYYIYILIRFTINIHLFIELY